MEKEERENLGSRKEHKNGSSMTQAARFVSFVPFLLGSAHTPPLFYFFYRASLVLFRFLFVRSFFRSSFLCGFLPRPLLFATTTTLYQLYTRSHPLTFMTARGLIRLIPTALAVATITRRGPLRRA
jgi:hypothetical protein